MATQPNKNNSLAAFARHLGINEATARQWKRRGKIRQSAEGYWATETDCVTGRDSNRDSVTVSSVTKRDSAPRKRDTVTERDAESVTLSRRVETLETELATVTAERDRLRGDAQAAESLIRELRAALASGGSATRISGGGILGPTYDIDLSPDWGA